MRNGEFLSYDSFRSLWQIIDYRTINKHRGNVREFVPRTLDFKQHFVQTPYLRKALLLDLRDIMGNTGKEGLHLACMGEAWQATNNLS